MKELYIPVFMFTLVFAFPDGSDGWLWRNEFEPPKNRCTQTDLISLRMVKSYAGWNGIELILLSLAILLKWDR